MLIMELRRSNAVHVWAAAWKHALASFMSLKWSYSMNPSLVQMNGSFSLIFKAYWDKLTFHYLSEVLFGRLEVAEALIKLSRVFQSIKPHEHMLLNYRVLYAKFSGKF